MAIRKIKNATVYKMHATTRRAMGGDLSNRSNKASRSRAVSVLKASRKRFGKRGITYVP